MSNSYVIKCGKLYDGLTDSFQNNVQILVEGNKIKEVGKKVAKPANAEEINLSDTTVTPGLSDAHVHFSFMRWGERRQETIFESPVWKSMSVLYNARKSLKRGFTTIRHMGSNSDDMFGSVTAKRMIDAGYFEGSRLVVTPHYVGTTRSHGDATQNLIASNPALASHIWESYPGYAFGADMFREVVRKQIKFGADFIKIFATGGFSTQSDGPEEQQLSDCELAAIIETAHHLMKKVTSHAYTPVLIKKLIDLGIDGIEHGALIDDPKILKLMKEKGVYLVPTFSPYDGIIYQDEDNISKQPYEMQLKLRKYAEWLRRAREVIIKSDIDLGYGTDFIAVHNPYDSGHEFKTWLKGGINPMRALKGATKVNAKILELEGKIGAIAPGYFADISAWKRDLLSDPEALLDCYFVMKDGVIYKTEKSE